MGAVWGLSSAWLISVALMFPAGQAGGHYIPSPQQSETPPDPHGPHELSSQARGEPERCTSQHLC